MIHPGRTPRSVLADPSVRGGRGLPQHREFARLYWPSDMTWATFREAVLKFATGWSRALSEVWPAVGAVANAALESPL